MKKENIDIILEKATVRDAKEILSLQKLAFRKEAELYNDFSISPITQTLEEITGEFKEKTFRKILYNGRIIGSIRAYKIDETCFIERLMVHPDFQGRGIGAELMREIEEYFKQAERYELIVRHKSEGNIRFYRKHGYNIFKREKYSKSLEFVYMRKKKGAPF